MKTLIIAAPFDPVSEKEISAVKKMQRDGGYRNVVLHVCREGVLSRELRLKLLKTAVSRYRRWSVSPAENEDAVTLENEVIESEAEVRGGAFLKAAKGIRRLLAENTWYYETALDACCKPKRAVHSRSVADVCLMLASAHGLDREQAWKAGILHDVTKAWSDEKGKAFLQVYAPEIVPLAPAIYHSYTCPVFLKTVMGIQDRLILSAIREHTLGTCSSDLSKILYIADKIEPTRGYDASEETALALRDLDAAFRLVFQEAAEYRERNRE